MNLTYIINTNLIKAKNVVIAGVKHTSNVFYKNLQLKLLIYFTVVLFSFI